MTEDAIAELDTEGVLAAVASAHREQKALECRQILLAAAWIDRHAPEDHADAPGDATGTSDAQGRRALPGAERFVPSGADGTPLIGEFAAAEFAAVQDAHPLWGSTMLRKVANLRERHPLLWSRVRAGEVLGWKSLEVARLVGREGKDAPCLTRAQARWVDTRTAAWIDLLPWSTFLELVEESIIAADPRGAEHRRLMAATRQGVWTTQGNEHGLKTMVARASAGDVIYLVAVVDRIADILAGQGDTRSAEERRAAALTLLARPAQALLVLASGAPEKAPTAHSAADACAGDAGAADAGAADAGAADEGADIEGAACDGAEPVPEPASPSYLDVPAGLLAVLAAVDQSTLAPAATLYVHLDATTLAAATTGTRFEGRAGHVAHVEGIGPVTVAQAGQWLRSRRVTVQPVLDPAGEPPVSGYVFPPRLREALRLLHPRDAFPFATSRGRTSDIDHVDPYRWPSRGGPKGQTGLHNAAPLTRRHHRLKTHGRWRLREVDRAVYLWTSPHGHHWLTDRNGSRPVPHAVAELLHLALDQVAEHPISTAAA